MPILGPSLLFCGKPACWIRGSNPQDKVNMPSPSPSPVCQRAPLGCRLKVTGLHKEPAASCLHFYRPRLQHV